LTLPIVDWRLPIAACPLRIACGLRIELAIANCGLFIVDCGMRIHGTHNPRRVFKPPSIVNPQSNRQSAVTIDKPNRQSAGENGQAAIGNPQAKMDKPQSAIRRRQSAVDIVN